jgi:phosphoglycolate phosphatase
MDRNPIKRAVLCDLDGPLLDTLDDLADSMNAALAGMGFAEHPVDAYRYFVGDGVDMLVKRVLPTNAYSTDVHAQLRTAMNDEYSRRWNAKSRPYSGIPELLDALQTRAIPMVILSNKPEPFTLQAVGHLLSDWTFSIVRGARPNVPTKPDPTAALDIAQALDRAPEDFLYVGDTNTDMQTARTAGMYALGATWGFRPGEELLQSGAQRLLDTPLELLDLL